jgi:hypothetical protein
MGVIRRSNLRNGDHHTAGYGFASNPPYALRLILNPAHAFNVPCHRDSALGGGDNRGKKMADTKKVSFRQPARGEEGAPPYSFYVERLFDAVKQVGTANGSGLFGGFVAIYYFGAKSHDLTNVLKLITAIYLGGILMFAFAYASFASFFINQEPSLSGSATYVPGSWRYVSGILFAVFSFVLWFFGSIIAAIALIML